MSTKNPFEIRTDILSMAKDYMDRQHDIATEFAKQAFDAAVQSGKVTTDTWKQYMPQMYSIEDLMKKAQEFYSFVSTK